MSDPAFDTAVEADVLRFGRPGTRWLSTGHDGGRSTADAAYNVTVPEGFDRTDLDAFLAERLAAAGFEPGPALLTGVAQRHARGARSGSVTVVATAGLSNPATLPMTPTGARARARGPSPGTVNVLLGTTRALDAGTLASLLATAVEAKTATLLATVGFTGTTSDAVVVGTDPDGDPGPFAGSSTDLGADARACVREAVRASLDARYADEPPPTSLDDARYGARTGRRATTFLPDAKD